MDFEEQIIPKVKKAPVIVEDSNSKKVTPPVLASNKNQYQKAFTDIPLQDSPTLVKGSEKEEEFNPYLVEVPSKTSAVEP